MTKLTPHYETTDVQKREELQERNRLGKRPAGKPLGGINQFSLPLGVWEGLRFVIVALPGLFSYLFFLFMRNLTHYSNAAPY